jgi:antitoxin HicB
VAHRETTLRYPAFVEKDGPRDWSVVFPDVPEAVTGGRTEAEAWANAPDALAVALASYPARRLVFPAPSRPKKDPRQISVPAIQAAKLFIRSELARREMNAADLARLLDIDHKAVRRILDLHHPSRMDQLELVLTRLGVAVTLIAA